MTTQIVQPIVEEPDAMSLRERVPTAELNVHLVKPCDLTQAQIDRWLEIQRRNQSVQNPLFGSHFTQVVARLRDDVEVAVLQNGEQCVGFFPFHRNRRDVARPVGLGLSDFHGIVADAGLEFDAKSLLRSCGLKAWHFDHLIAEQLPFAPFHWRTAASPFIDLSDGFEAYRQDRRASGSDSVKQVLRKIRKIEREVGPLRFEPFATDDDTFETAIEWKQQHYRRIKSVNHLAESWKVNLLKSIVANRSDAFEGMLSTLYAGEHLIAVHMGVLENGILHCWFPSYSEDFAKYSPGLIFWVRLAQEAESLEIHRIDLGKGSERYKRNLMSGQVIVAEGSVDLRPISRVARRLWHGAREYVRSSPLKTPVQKFVRGIRGAVKYK